MNLSAYYFLFYQFLTTYNRVYDEQTFNRRFEVFVDNYKYIDEMNKKENTFTLGLTPFADLTLDEFRLTHLGVRNTSDTVKTVCGEWKASANTPPQSLDWRDKNIISPIKDQGQCGSCWAFAATETLESAYALLNGDLEILSPQELVDCDTTSYGCSGGYPDHALEYIIAHGLETEKEYPYTAQDGKCQEHDTQYKLSECFHVPVNDEQALMRASADAPLVVLIEADQRVFQLYTSGIIDARSCGQNIDHAVQLVGYGTENDKDYWLVRNSWGASWGESGYVRLERNSGVSGGTCGILTGPSGFSIK